jgi:hypothetical protein
VRTVREVRGEVCRCFLESFRRGASGGKNLDLVGRAKLRKGASRACRDSIEIVTSVISHYSQKDSSLAGRGESQGESRIPNRGTERGGRGGALQKRGVVRWRDSRS